MRTRRRTHTHVHIHMAVGTESLADVLEAIKRRLRLGPALGGKARKTLSWRRSWANFSPL